MAMAAIVWLYCVFMFDGRRELFRDADTGWHIRTGERIAMTMQLPAADPYSFTVRGKPWFAWEWLSDVAMGAVHAKWGLQGVAVLFISAIAATVWLWIRFNWAAGGDFLLACAFLPLFLPASSIHWLARPHVLSWPLILGAVWVAERAPVRQSRRFLIVLFGCGALWANLHASFLIAPLTGLLYAVGLWTAAWVWPATSSGSHREAHWLAFACVSFLAGTLVNPYGWRLHQHVLSYLADSDLLDRVAEFQSFNFHARGAGQIAAVMTISFLGAAVAAGQRKLGRCLLMLCLLVMALRSARAIPVVALVCLPLTNGSLRSWWNNAWEARTGPRDMNQRLVNGLRGAAGYSANLLTIDRHLGGIALAPLFLAAGCAVMALPGMATSAGFSPKDFPVAAANRVADLPADARLLSTDKFGGYLIYRFAGQRPVFFDGRSDLYGSEFMKQYLKLVELRPGWEQVLNGFQPTHALLPADAPLRHALEKDGWRALYSDNVAFLLERPRM